MKKPIQLVIDILIVVAASVLAFLLEDLAVKQAWIVMPAAAVGVSAVLAGVFAAISIVLIRGGSLADLGLRRPERWAWVPLQVVGIVFAFAVAQYIAPPLVSLFTVVPEPDLSKYDSITHNFGAALLLALTLPLTASIPEEIIYRGFLIGRLLDIFGQNKAGMVAAVLVQAIFFGSVHFGWGFGGVVVTVVMGIVWGTAYLLCGRNLWVVIIAHSSVHILFVTQLYLGVSIIV